MLGKVGIQWGIFWLFCGNSGFLGWFFSPSSISESPPSLLRFKFTEMSISSILVFFLFFFIVVYYIIIVSGFGFLLVSGLIFGVVAAVVVVVVVVGGVNVVLVVF